MIKLSYKNVLLFFTTRNRRLLVFLLAKSPKGTKNALVARPHGDPLTGLWSKSKECPIGRFRFYAPFA